MTKAFAIHLGSVKNKITAGRWGDNMIFVFG